MSTPRRSRRSRPRHRPGLRTPLALAAVMVGVLSMLLFSGGVASATSFVPISGEGSSWSANAIDQWISDVQADGMRVNYTANGSTAGRQDWISGITDFAATDIPFQTDPTDGTSAPEHPQAGSYAYMPITAGGTVFMYNLKINGQQVTNLRLSGENIAKIYTGQITNWDSPLLAADNPGLKLPNQEIVPVVRADGAGSSYELSEWMISQYPSVWNAYCNAAGRNGQCGPTSFWPTGPDPAMIAKSGDLGVAADVSASYANGSIGYVEYSYALNDHFPVVQMLNAAGYYTEPTAQNVAVSLLAAKINTDASNPAVYLTENLQGVYTDPDPRTYPLSSYSYLILPTKVQGQFSAAKGTTLAAFSYFAMCQGQQQSAELGYSPMPINLVEASFAQIAKIPGADVHSVNIQGCNNPTFSPNGTNLLVASAPYPPACDKQGPTQCSTATGGAAVVVTLGGATTTTAAGGSKTSTTQAAGTSGTGSTGGSSSTGSATGTGGGSSASGSSSACDPSAGNCSASSAASSTNDNPLPLTSTIPVSSGWGTTETLISLIIVLVLAIIFLPGLLVGYLDRRAGRRTP